MIKEINGMESKRKRKKKSGREETNEKDETKEMMG